MIDPTIVNLIERLTKLELTTDLNTAQISQRLQRLEQRGGVDEPSEFQPQRRVSRE